jgi:hypothetical protein
MPLRNPLNNLVSHYGRTGGYLPKAKRELLAGQFTSPNEWMRDGHSLHPADAVDCLITQRTRHQLHFT